MEHSEFSDSNSIGGDHRENQDSLLVDEEKSIFAIADGVGGYEGGKIASLLAVQLLQENLGRDSTERDLRECIRQIHDDMQNQAKELDHPYMGTTLAVCKIVSSDSAICANVGDSPIFLVRNGSAVALYQDDSERYSNPQNTWSLTQYLGLPVGRIEVHSRITDLMKGDVLLICSDGVSDNLFGGGLGSIAELAKPLDAKQLVEAAIKKNLKHDDMSAILIHL
ncbi:MAG TPA: PP2C family serine/threonine-protein phosphatase [Nitrososphaerales archaeon]|nr:PP2C family serine/threonine-protein phosphatase [Nitrososphaerales archaeon]